MKLTSIFNVVAIAAALLTTSANASIIKYDMTFTGGKTASITFDDQATPVPPGYWAGAGYLAMSLVIDGSSIAGGLMLVYNDYQGFIDMVYFTAPDSSVWILMGDLPGLFSSEAASQMTNKTFANFLGTSNGNNKLSTGETMLTLVRTVVVPEPGSLALLGLGLAGLAAARRRRTAIPALA